MKTLSAVFALYVAVVLVSPAGARDSEASLRSYTFPQPYGYYQADQPYTNEFKKHVSDGMRALKDGDLGKGIALLFQASRMTWQTAQPNFELWDDIAEAECRSGDIWVGQSLLKDYRCAVEQASGDRQCYLHFGDNMDVPNAAMTPQCFRAVCGEVGKPFDSQLANASEDQKEIDSGRAELRRVDKLIKSCHPPAPTSSYRQPHAR